MSAVMLILEPGIYGDEYGRAKTCKAGDLHTTTQQYGDVVVATGKATWDIEPELLVPDPVEPDKPKVAVFTDVKGVNDDINTALLAVGYTWETLAGAKVADLTPISGLGAKTATKLIDRAKAEVEDEPASTD